MCYKKETIHRVKNYMAQSRETLRSGVKSSQDHLKNFKNLPKDIKTGIEVRIYKEDIFKIIGDGEGNFSELIKIF
jgi:hypothetical protein